MFSRAIKTKINSSEQGRKYYNEIYMYLLKLKGCDLPKFIKSTTHNIIL